MSEFKVNGELSKILPIVTGNKKDGSGQWKKVDFVVTNNDGYEGREMLYAFQIFGDEKVDNFIKYNQEGNQVEVKFSIQTNEHNGRYYTNLSAFRVESGERVEQSHQTPAPEELESDLPF